MAEATPLVVLFDQLREDSAERAAFEDDPNGFLASHGWGDIEPREVVEALEFARESMPLDVAVRIPLPETDDADVEDVMRTYVEAAWAEPVIETDDADLDDFGADAIFLDGESDRANEEPGVSDEDDAGDEGNGLGRLDDVDDGFDDTDEEWVADVDRHDDTDEDGEEDGLDF